MNIDFETIRRIKMEQIKNIKEIKNCNIVTYTTHKK